MVAAVVGLGDIDEADRSCGRRLLSFTASLRTCLDLMVALSPFCDVVRGARGESCSASGMVASVGGCGDDNLKPRGDEKGSSFVAESDLRWRPGVVTSDFARNPCSASIFQEYEPSYLMVRKTEPCVQVVCAQGSWEVSLPWPILTQSLSMQTTPHHELGVQSQHPPTHAAIAGCSPPAPVALEQPWILDAHYRAKPLRFWPSAATGLGRPRWVTGESSVGFVT